MTQAIITSGFTAGSSAVNVTADVANGIDILVYDDETKELIGTGEITSGSVSVTVSPVLYSGQRIIAYVTSFGSQTYGAVIVVDSDVEFTGWKTPETVGSDTYEDYLEAGGQALPDLYDPQAKRNISRDKDAIDRVIDLPITFRLRQVESQAGTVQVIVEDIQNAIGGFKIKFDSDAEGTTATKTYSANGSYQVKVWGANQTIADAILKTYNLIMPTASVVFGPNVKDLFVFVDWNNTGFPGERPVILYANSSVSCQFQIAGEFTWADGVWDVSGLSFRSNILILSAGEYTVEVRNKDTPAETISRQIKLSGF
jgi:hypothetical protein